MDEIIIFHFMFACKLMEHLLTYKCISDKELKGFIHIVSSERASLANVYVFHDPVFHRNSRYIKGSTYNIKQRSDSVLSKQE